MGDLATYAALAETNKTSAYSLLENNGTEGSFLFTGDSVANVSITLNKDHKLTVKVFKYLDNNTNLHDNLGSSQ